MSFENFCQADDNFFIEVKSFITDAILKRKYESKKSIKSRPVRYMCHANTCVPHEIRDE